MQITDKTIQIVDISENIDQEFVKILRDKGFSVDIFKSPDEFLDDFSKNSSGFIIINVKESDMKIFNLCSVIRMRSTVPVIIVSEKSLENDLVTAINMGCDEYIAKPVSSMELLARVSSILRRIEYENQKSGECVYSFGDIVINLRRHEVLSGSEILHLTNKEFEVLLYLIDHSDRVAGRSEMLSNIWGFSSDLIETRAIDDCIKRLRKKLADSSSNVKIETVRGHGFRISIA